MASTKVHLPTWLPIAAKFCALGLFSRFALIAIVRRLLGSLRMAAFTVIVAVANLALGFLLAVYSGAAPRYYNPRFPILREGLREPTGFVARIVALVRPRRSA